MRNRHQPLHPRPTRRLPHRPDPPTPTARILGCALHLAGIDIGARFWWQYAAGAEDAPASYCLHLQHLAHGETHAAALWHAQADAYTAQQEDTDPVEYAPALHSMNADTSLATVLRVLAQLTRTLPTRRHTPAARAVIEFVASAVTGGYTRHPDLEMPLPGTYFAEQLEIIVAATTSTRDHFQPAPAHAAPTNTSTSPAEDLPNRLAPDEGRKHILTKAAPAVPNTFWSRSPAPTTNPPPRTPSSRTPQPSAGRPPPPPNTTPAATPWPTACAASPNASRRHPPASASSDPHHPLVARRHRCTGCRRRHELQWVVNRIR